jgi:flavorubredoxin/flavin reductase (DIM6/NTAB) family NADH-FMN oxidoreductase RutF
MTNPTSSQTSPPRDTQIAEIATNTTALRSRTWDRLKFEVEYARQKGTTANSYLIHADKIAVLDPPGESFTQIYLEALQGQIDWQALSYIILGHVNSNRMVTLKALFELAPQAVVVCSKPAANALKVAFADYPLQINPVRGEEVLNLGQGHELQFAFVPTPRHPDALVTYDPATRILYTDKLFGAHVCDEAVFDENWKAIDEDRHHYFQCIHAAQARQVEAALDRLNNFNAKFYAPGHGSIVRYSVSRLKFDYREWCQQQQSQDATVTLLYASAYGNTATMATAIAQGLVKADVAVESINCEFANPTEVAQSVEKSDGFIIGSPTLGGHAPIQIQTALGTILSSAAKTKLAGVFGSYGWSGEAVDLLEGKLQDAGYSLGFETIRVKFKPTEAVLQHCEQAGAEFAQALRKTRKIRVARQPVVDAQVDRTSQAVGRIVGSLCVLTIKQGDTHNGMLTSWVSQATFSPPGLTIALPKEQFAEQLVQSGEAFVLNILKEGRNLRRYFLKPLSPGENRFAEIATHAAENDCLILDEALAYLECTVKHRMECGDHWLIYATVDGGKVLEPIGVTAVQHRKTGHQY